MKKLTTLLICLVAVALFCAGCKKEEKTTTTDPNSRVTLSQDRAATQKEFLLDPDVATCEQQHSLLKGAIAKNRDFYDGQADTFLFSAENQGKSICFYYFFPKGLKSSDRRPTSTLLPDSSTLSSPYRAFAYSWASPSWNMKDSAPRRRPRRLR